MNFTLMPLSRGRVESACHAHCIILHCCCTLYTTYKDCDGDGGIYHNLTTLCCVCQYQYQQQLLVLVVVVIISRGQGGARGGRCTGVQSD